MLGLSLIISLLYLRYIDYRLNKVMGSYVVLEAERITSNVVRKVINDFSDKYSYEDFVSISRNKNGSIERIDYNSNINSIRKKIANTVDSELYKMESGKYNNYDIYQYINSNNSYKYIRKGFLCEFSINALQNSTLFGNIGPSVPLRLSFIGYSLADIDINIREYGVNNALIEVNVIVNVNCAVSMPVNSKKVKLSVKEPIIMEIVSGDVPNYYVN